MALLVLAFPNFYMEMITDHPGYWYMLWRVMQGCK